MSDGTGKLVWPQMEYDEYAQDPTRDRCLEGGAGSAMSEQYPIQPWTEIERAAEADPIVRAVLDGFQRVLGQQQLLIKMVTELVRDRARLVKELTAERMVRKPEHSFQSDTEDLFVAHSHLAMLERGDEE